MADVFGAEYSNFFAGQPEQEPEKGNFGRGLEIGAKSLGQQFYGLGAKIAADMGGDPTASLEKSRDYAQQAAALARPGDEWSDVNSLSDFGRYAAVQAGQLVPQLAPALVGGAGAARLGGRLIESAAGKALIERGVAKGLTEAAARDAAIATLKKVGTDATMFGIGAGQGVGTLYPSLEEMGNEDAADRATLYGAVAGGIGVLPGIRAANKLIGGELQAANRTYLRRLGREVVGQGMLGGAAGVGQNVVNREALGMELSGDEANTSNTNAFAAGFLGGAFMSPVTALHRNVINPQKRDTQNVLGGANEQPRNAIDVRESPNIPTQQWVDQTVGVRPEMTERQRAARMADIEAAMGEPTQFRNVDPATGVETGPKSLFDLHDEIVGGHEYQRPTDRPLAIDAQTEWQERFLGQRAADPTGPINLLGDNASPTPARGVESATPAPSYASLGADAYRRRQAGELLSPFETVAARQYAASQAPDLIPQGEQPQPAAGPLEIPPRPNLKTFEEPAPAPSPAAERLRAPAESELAQRILGQRGEPAGEPLILPEQPAPAPEQRIVGMQDTRAQTAAAMEKLQRGELLTPVERDLVNQALAEQDARMAAPAPKLELPPVRRAREEPAQPELPGVERAIERAEPRVERAVEEQESRGSQPGQYEMFGPKGEPTYAADRGVEPNYEALAEATAREAKYKLTDKRRPLAVEVERAVAEGRMSDDDKVTAINALTQSKYGVVDRLLKDASEAEARTRAAEKAKAASEAEVAAAKAKTDEGAVVWDDYHVEGDPTFDKLPKALQDEWVKAVGERKATNDLYENIVRRAEDTEWGKNRGRTHGDVEQTTPSVKREADKLAGDDNDVKSQRGRATAAEVDSATMRGLSDGTKLVDHLATNAKSPLVRMLAQKLARLPELSKVRVLTDSPELRARIPENVQRQLDGSNAIYAHGPNVIISRAHNEVSLVHELLHAATMGRIRGDEGARRAFERFYHEATRALEAKYGRDAVAPMKKDGALENLDEFIAYGFSQPEFRQILSDVRLPGEKPTAPSVWQRFVGLVRRVLGMPEREGKAIDSVLSEFDNKPLLESMDIALDRMLSKDGTLIGPDDAVASSREWGVDPEEMKRAAKQAPKEFAQALSINNLGRLRRGKLAMMFSRDLANNYGDAIQGPKGESVVKQYVDHAFEMATTANELLKKAGDAIQRWGSVKDVEALNELAWKSTIMGINPDEPISATNSNKHLITDGKVADSVRANHATLRKAWDALTPEAKAAYKETRKLLADNWNRREVALNKQVMETYAPLIERAKLDGNESKAKSLTRERDSLIRDFGVQLKRIDGPYFPLMRFGDYFVNFKSPEYVKVEEALNAASEELRALVNKYDLPVGMERRIAEKLNKSMGEDEQIKTKLTPEEQDEVNAARKKVRELEDKLSGLKDKEQHYSSESFETEAAATRRAQELNVPVRRAAEHFRELNPINRGFMDRLSQSLEAALPPGQVQAAREAMAKLYLQTLPDTSAMKNQMRRENVAGFSKNMSRNIAAYTRREAHYLSRLEHMDDLTSTLMQMERGAKESDDPLRATELYNEMAKRHVASMNYTETPIQDAITRLSFAYQLGVSPAFLLTNMSQPWMLSAPMLASRHGLRAVGELGRAFGEVGRNLTTAMKENGIHTELDLSKFKDGERQMLEDSQRKGLLDVTMEADLGAYERGADPTSKLSRFSRALSVAPHQVEVVNRAMTALAAYRMEMENGATPEAATAYAQKVLSDTHFDYSNINAPRPFRPGVLPFGKLITQYRKYQVGVISLLANQAKQMTKGATPAERAEARRALIGTVGLHLLVSGAMGIPGATTVLAGINLAHSLFGDDDEAFDAESEFRNYLAGALGVEGGAAFSKGLPVLAGLDLSRKVGLGDIFQPVNMGGAHPKTYSDLGKEMLVAGMGPAVGQGLNMLQGLDYLGDGQYGKAMEKFIPKSVGDILKAARYGTEGITTKRGDVSIEPDRVGMWDQALAGLGFTPTLVSERGAAVSAINEAKNQINDRRTELMRDWVRAYAARDAEGVSAARAAIDHFNEVRKRNGEQIIKPADLLNSYKARQRGSKSMTEQGVMLSKKDQPLAKRANFAYVP